MDLATITMPVEAAQERLDAFAKQVASERTDQDRRIIRGYQSLVKGYPIIELSKSVAAGGFFEDGLPKIAVARADSQDCWVVADSGDLLFSTERPQWRARNRGALVNATTVRVHVSDRPTMKYRWEAAHTIMPMIPPEHRPNKNRLHLFHILWEVEAWELVAPRDPALLKWIAGDLWEVCAMWDLTDLERAVLSR